VANHGYPSGSKVRISGATPTGYNGVFTISNVTTNTFQYSVSSNLADATGTITANQGSSTLVTATAPGHGFGDGASVTISITNADPIDFAGSFVITLVNSDTFTFNTSVRVPANLGTAMTALSGTSTEATVTAADHGFVTGDSITISGVTGPDSDATDGYNRTAIITVVDSDSFTYSTAPFAPSPATTSGTITAAITGKAIATLPSHGYADGDILTIKGSSISEFNKNDVTITKIDDDTFRYTVLTVTSKGTASGTITANKKTTTARVRAVSHGFSSGDAVAIDTNPSSDFEGTFTITVTDSDNFTYDLTENDPSNPAQGDATGTITASFGSGSSGELTDLVNWVRGADNFDNENGTALTPPSYDVRASIHGDVLHSRPAVVNYNRNLDDADPDNDNDDVYVFYGSNDGVFRAVKGGFTSELGQADPGGEVWGFIPEEHFTSLERMRNNEPIISSSNKKPYFVDGTLGVYVRDVDDDGNSPGDGVIDDLTNSDPDKNDKVWIFLSMRRGGRLLYALDVSDPDNPKFMWKVQGGNDDGYQELGHTWSAPQVKTLNTNSGKPVLIFGAGYDPLVEDLVPEDIIGITATTVSTSTETATRSMGRGIYVLDAETGTILWQAGRVGGANANGTHTYKEVSGMDCAIPSDITVITDRNGTVDNRGYVGDTCGNLWRIDMASSLVTAWTVTKLAAVGDTSGLSDTPPDPSGLRKFLFPPDVVYGVGDDGTLYDAVLLGSGDREHPFDTTVVNRFYMFKDLGTGTSATTTGLDEDDLFDATTDCLDVCNDEDVEAALEDLSEADGWFITLEEGEKVIGNSVTLNNVTFFNTNVPTSSEDAAADTTCDSDLGEARQYKVLYDDATALADQNNTGGITALDRYTTHPGGGYLPSPVPVVVEIDGNVYEGVISGVAVDKPPGSLLNARLRKFWYKEEAQ
jgi:Tfp pilus tip-associated adhesin PilY1